MSTPLRVIDPHFHVWDLAGGNYPGLETPGESFYGSNAAIARSYLFEELLAEGGGEVVLEGAVHVEAIAADPLAETRDIQAVADRAPVPIGIVAHVDLGAPDAAAQLEAHKEAAPALRGIRQILNTHADPLYSYVSREFIDEPQWQAGFGLLAGLGLSFDMQLYPTQMARAAALAGRHPDTSIVLNHAGMWADRDLAGWRLWRDGMRALAGHENVAVKISGLGMLDPEWTIGSIRPLVLETLDAFGPERVMFASNFPVDKIFSDYGTVWRAFAAIIADLSETERQAMLVGNARRIYRL